MFTVLMFVMVLLVPVNHKPSYPTVSSSHKCFCLVHCLLSVLKVFWIYHTKANKINSIQNKAGKRVS